MAQQLNNAKAIITGTSDGIGLAIAKAFASEGADIWLVARNKEKLPAAAQSLRSTGVDVRFMSAGLTEPDAIEGVADEISHS